MHTKLQRTLASLGVMMSLRGQTSQAIGIKSALHTKNSGALNMLMDMGLGTKDPTDDGDCEASWLRLFSTDKDTLDSVPQDVPYEDLTFPPTSDSLYTEWMYDDLTSDFYRGVVESMDSVELWRRPNLFSDSPLLWGSKGIQPHGVMQGSIGDCWFLASAAAVAEYPERIERIFTNTEYPANGMFEIEFFVSGEPVKVVIDDQLPM